MGFAEVFKEQKPEPGHIAIAWLGQAGFLIKNSQDQTLAVDVYLSDLVERQDGPKRLSPILADAAEINADVVLASHHHADHLDLDSIPVFLENHARLYCCRESARLCRQAGLPMEQVMAMGPGDCVSDSGFRMEAVFADHGDTAPQALGFLIGTEGLRIYFTGDTSYQPERMSGIANQPIDLMLVPINGEYGNMNECDAAMLAGQLKPGLTIPCHFWTFARHQGSPYHFQQEMKAIAPGLPVYLMAQGEIKDIIRSRQ